MILQGKTPKALSFTVLAGVAGIGLLLLPLVPGWGQPPADEAKTQREREKGDRPKQDPDALRFQELVDRIRAENERFRAEIEKIRAESMLRLQLRLQPKDDRKGPNERGVPGHNPREPGNDFPIPPQGGRGNLADQRLMDVERKLEALLQEVCPMRRDMMQGPKGPEPRQPGPDGGQPDAEPSPPEGGPNPPRSREGDAIQNPLPNPPNINLRPPIRRR